MTALGLIFVSPQTKTQTFKKKGCKAVKAIQDKLDAEMAAHCQTKEKRDKLHEEGTKKEGTITTLRE